MPFLTVDKTPPQSFIGITTDTRVVYNMAYTANGSQAYGVSVQITVANSSGSQTIKVQGSNDGTNWGDLTGDLNNGDGTYIYSGTPFCHYISVQTAFTSGALDQTIIFYATNQS